MKDRIIHYLGDFSEGKDVDLSREMRQRMEWDAPVLQERSNEVLTQILHDYSQFSISTIDAFFQRVIRSFTRESGLLGNFRLEADNDLVLNEVIAELMDELGDTNKQLTDWVIQFSSERLTEGESWNIMEALKGFATEIFKENFKAIVDDVQHVHEKISFPDFLATLRKEKAIFLNFMKSRAQKAMQILRLHHITSDDFNYKESGTPFKYFKEFEAEHYTEAKPRLLKSVDDSASWASKNSPRNRELKQLADQSLIPLLKEMIEFDRKNGLKYNSVDLVERNFYSYGLIADITRKLKDYKAENNLMLLSDASHFLHGVINNSDTPFIYEKVGSFFRHYLIDEFQDTSVLQWKNFQPLLLDGLDQNQKSMVVGDVKQSIYRWRGGDQRLLQETVEKEVGSERTEKHVLKENWRSAENLVQFNNELFSIAAQRVGQATGQPLPMDSFQDIEQAAVKHKGKGFIRIQFLEKWKGKDDDQGAESALEQVPLLLEQLQSQGARLHDIAILVRKNEEGQRIASYLLQYKNSSLAKSGLLYDVVSNESLRLDAASAVMLLISALKYLDNPHDAIAQAELVYEHFQRRGPQSPREVEIRFSQAGKRKTDHLLPEEFVRQAPWLVKLSLFELTETLIQLFRLGEDGQELAYLQSFQDLVLEFVTQEKNDIASFLEWWEQVKAKRSLQVAANDNAAGIYTIHGAKGLQFKYVIVPFCNWSMNHDISPLLWCRSAEKPFDQLGYVAVRYTSKLEQSFFADDYLREFTKAYVDNLNLLYVAFTRAEEGMMAIAPKRTPKKQDDSRITNVGQLVFEAIQQSTDLQQNWDDVTSVFSVGKMEKLPGGTKEDDFIPVSLNRYPSVDWRKKLVVRQEGTEFFQTEKTAQRQRINYGVLIHRVLSLVHYKSDVSDVLKKLNFEGVIGEEEASQLQKTMTAMMDHPTIGNWYSKEWQVRTEAPVIIPGGRPGRLDRVIFKDILKKGQSQKKAVIIDYKTGTKKTEDRKQVEEYSRLLSQMGYVDVEAYLLYLDSLQIMLVVDKMNLNLF